MTDPQPPYRCPMPARYENTPYADLPPALKQRVDQATPPAPPAPPEPPPAG